nr:hypothetical protein [Mesorhizobium sp. WSM2561]
MTGLEEPCDVLIPAAMENAIHIDNAERIKAHLIVEAANGPVTFQADQVMRSRGVMILPDLYVNAGGVVVSYFEWVKNLTHIPFGLMERRRRERRNQTIATALERMTGKTFPAEMRDEFLEGGAEIDLVRSGLEDVMRSTWARIADLLEEQPELGDYRTAAYVASMAEFLEPLRGASIRLQQSDRLCPRVGARSPKNSQRQAANICVYSVSLCCPTWWMRTIEIGPTNSKAAIPIASTLPRWLWRAVLHAAAGTSN